MIKSNTLLLRAGLYSLLCQSSIRSDMAQRIMYSILPSLSDPAQIYHTKGVVDYNALSHAIDGRHDIIKYGIRACLKELKHYKGTLPTELHVSNDVDKDQYTIIINAAIKCFDDLNKWSISYGGKAWGNIAKTLAKIISLDKNLDEVKASNDKDKADKIVQIMQLLVIELNVFDGLSHNTASVMKNLIQAEYYDKHYKQNEDFSVDSYDEILEEFNKTRRLMDAKELTNPMDVYKEIKQTLVDSGSINKFKDWNTKLRNSPEYFKENPNKENEFFRIVFRKLNLNNRQELETFYETFKNMTEILKLKNENYKSELLDYLPQVSGVRHTVAEIKYSLEKCQHDFTSEKIQQLIENLDDGFSFFETEIINHYNNLSTYVEDLKFEFDPENEKETINNLTNCFKQLLLLIRKTIIYIDSI